MEFKDQIKHARETVHMSQQEFAAAIGVPFLAQSLGIRCSQAYLCASA